jgi:hypothetical protein
MIQCLTEMWGIFFYNIFPSCSNCSSSEAETRNPMHIHQPLGSARGATLGSAQTVRRAKPRREIQCIYLHPSASLGVHSASLGVHSASLGVQPSASLGVQSKRNSHCPGKCSFYPNIFTHSPTCVHMKSASGTSV